MVELQLKVLKHLRENGFYEYINQARLAKALGITRKSVGKALAMWHYCGYLKLTNFHYEEPDMATYCPTCGHKK